MLVAARAFSSPDGWRLLSSYGAWASYRGGFSCGACVLARVGLSICGTTLNFPLACGILVPVPGIKLVSLALAGRVLTTDHQGSPEILIPDGTLRL